MASFRIRQFPDPSLRKISSPVLRLDRRLREFIDRLIETMRRQPGGIGIAAPQVGVLKRIAIVDVSAKIPGAQLRVLINPEIVEISDPETYREGCMSLPDFTANVRRGGQIRVSFQDLEMRKIEISAEGLEARCIQHEVDHLNGMLFVDRVTSLKTDVFRRKRYL